MRGVIPTPPAISTMLSASAPVNVNRPDGASTSSRRPGPTESWRCRDDSPRSSRLIVSSQYPTRVGRRCDRVRPPDLLAVDHERQVQVLARGESQTVGGVRLADARRNVRTSGVSSNTCGDSQLPGPGLRPSRAGTRAGRIGTSWRPRAVAGSGRPGDTRRAAPERRRTRSAG